MNAPLAAEERSRLRSRICMSLCNLVRLHLFWSPSTRRIYARTPNGTIPDLYGAARGRPALPPDALHVGFYEQGVPSAHILEDLEYVIAHPPAPVVARCDYQAPQPSIAAPKPVPETTWHWHEWGFNEAPIKGA